MSWTRNVGTPAAAHNCFRLRRCSFAFINSPARGAGNTKPQCVPSLPVVVLHGVLPLAVCQQEPLNLYRQRDGAVAAVTLGPVRIPQRPASSIAHERRGRRPPGRRCARRSPNNSPTRSPVWDSVTKARCLSALPSAAARRTSATSARCGYVHLFDGLTWCPGLPSSASWAR